MVVNGRCESSRALPAAKASSRQNRGHPVPSVASRPSGDLELTRSRGHLKIGAGEPLLRSPHAEKSTALPARISRGSG